MTRFILRQTRHDIYRVMMGDKTVGSIVHHTEGAEPFWSWSVTAIIADPPGSIVQGGSAPTKDAAVSAWRACWEAIEDGPHGWVPEPPAWRPGRRGSPV
jgi:hypothetical protein